MCPKDNFWIHLFLASSQPTAMFPMDDQDPCFPFSNSHIAMCPTDMVRILFSYPATHKTLCVPQIWSRSIFPILQLTNRYVSHRYGHDPFFTFSNSQTTMCPTDMARIHVFNHITHKLLCTTDNFWIHLFQPLTHQQRCVPETVFGFTCSII
jgi:hypothetical protein